MLGSLNILVIPFQRGVETLCQLGILKNCRSNCQNFSSSSSFGEKNKHPEREREGLGSVSSLLMVLALLRPFFIKGLNGSNKVAESKLKITWHH